MMKGMVFADRYQLADFIGQGGMSLVYRAVDIRTGHSVAVKILKSEYNSDAEFLERFQREAQAASLMAHHNIVNLLDVGVEGEYRYLVLEYVSGNTLKEIIQQKGILSTNTAIQIAIRILSALQHAHDNGIIHRDIKPQNVLVHSDGHVKVADFGIARMTNAFTISKGDTVVGSVHYSSPEQASGTVVDATSDIYSTGVVLYEMLTGRVPFTGDTPVAVAMQHIKAAPQSILDYNPNVSPAVVAVVMKALEKSPKKRFQSAREMADTLIRARDGKEEVPPAPENAGMSRPGPQAMETKGARPQESRARAANAHTARMRSLKRRARRQLSSFLTVLMVLGVLGILSLGVIQIYQQVTNSAVTPELIGISLEEAQTLIRRAGLKLQMTEVNHDTIQEGVVISQVPDADTAMTKGDSVVLMVSLGPVSAVVPEVTGLTREEAAAKLKEKGLGMVVFKIASTEPLETVISQNPRQGEHSALGAEVEVTISGGSTLVPDVTGKTQQGAEELLGDNRLVLSRIEYAEVEDEKLIGQVVAQSPTAGTMATLDAQVTLTIAKKSKEYHSEISITIPKAEEGRSLRVVLLDNGQNVEQYATALPATGSETTLLVPLSSDTRGKMTCKVYLNDALWDEQEVELR